MSDQPSSAGLSENQQLALELLIPLTEEERLDARDRARKNVIRAFGTKPSRAQFREHTSSEYPNWLTFGVSIMLLIVFFAAANVSIFRVFTAGRDHFAETIDVGWQAALVGVSAFLLAEFMVIAATIAQRIYFKGRSRWLMTMPIMLGLLMAFVGNWTISQPQVELTAMGMWSILETATPPAAVLFMALIGERLILETLRNRHMNEQAFQEALVKWEGATAEPEKSPQWQSSYANALKETIREVNSRGRGSSERREFMAGMGGADWSVVVWREIRADEWFEHIDPFGLTPSPAAAGEQSGGQPTPVVAANGSATTAVVQRQGMPNGNGHSASRPNPSVPDSPPKPLTN